MSADMAAQGFIRFIIPDDQPGLKLVILMLLYVLVDYSVYRNTYTYMLRGI
jgi:hypothetical protein